MTCTLVQRAKVNMMSKQQRSGSAKHTKTTLLIEQKFKVLDYAKENPKESCRTLSAKFSVGKTQIAAILKNETELRTAYATYRGNNPENNKRARQGRYQEINEALYKWYSLARESLVPINGPILQEEAAEIAKQLAKNPNMLNSRFQVNGLRNGKPLTVFLNVLLRGNLVKFRSKQLKPGWKECL